MAATTFDTLGYFEKLKAAGFSESQAKAQVEVIREIIEDKVATKRDVQELKRDMREMEARLETKIKELELRLTTRFGAMLAAAVAIIAALNAFMK